LEEDVRQVTKSVSSERKRRQLCSPRGRAPNAERSGGDAAEQAPRVETDAARHGCHTYAAPPICIFITVAVLAAGASTVLESAGCCGLRVHRRDGGGRPRGTDRGGAVVGLDHSANAAYSPETLPPPRLSTFRLAGERGTHSGGDGGVSHRRRDLAGLECLQNGALNIYI
jgi:hypothetical protein